ncbi:ATP-binding protein [Xinfangfangia pollutisoli]|uniref:ATP-binding protein n=1 Tax=Xinfangfangia pollutisoli TaxID=2865960 RepID=UPI001CD78646|nr:ATP-binding protein [Xinfangfangia pollutisoli]
MVEQLETELLEGIPLPALIVAADERIAAMNAPAQALLGEAAVGRNLALALRAPELLRAIDQTLAEGASREVLLRLSDDGQYRAQVSPLQAGGRRALCVLRDITVETQAEQMRRDFVANVSHELRTPLTAMMGFIETLRTSAKDDPVARERFLAIMEREAGRMNRLVRDLLQLSRVEAEERVRPREAVDLAGVLKSVAATVRAAAEEKQSRIEISGGDRPVMVTGDPDQLTQVFLNLIENAVKYGGTGQVVQVSISREPSYRGPALRVDVADQGEGIEAIHLPRLTERFYRIDAHRSRAEGGTGLGLAIVKHIVNRHRGWLKIDSKRGEGSVFSVILPEV